jgi:hypothetical protein
MDGSLDHLVAISSGPICSTAPKGSPLAALGSIGQQLSDLLARKNGFYAFGAALLMRPYKSLSRPLGIEEWNNVGLWKHEWSELLDNVLCFAEDVFGGQFCVKQEKIYAFDPETADFEYMCDNLESWANIILTDTNFRTGETICQTWQKAHGPLRPGLRLAPITPFVLGGKYEVENVSPRDEVEAVGFRLNLARQLRDLPDGAQVVIHTQNN